MKRIKTSLLIGVTSFIGCYLADYLVQKGGKVIGTYRHLPKDFRVDKQVRLVRCEVTKSREMETVIRRFRPDCVYYLAAQSSVREAWYDPVGTIQVNLLGGVYLLEILKKIKRKFKLLVFSSGTTYGHSHGRNLSLDEEACLIPKDPYSVSKTGIDFFARLYAKVHELPVAVVRLANFMGPRQSKTFSVSNFAYQIAGIEAGRFSPVIRVGNLKAERDYLDVRDGVRAIYLAMKHGKKGEAYHIAAGKSRRLKDVLNQLKELSRIPGQIKIVKKVSLMSKDEIPSVKLRVSKFRRLTGWKPKIPFKQTLWDILQYWRGKWHEA